METQVGNQNKFYGKLATFMENRTNLWKTELVYGKQNKKNLWKIEQILR